MAQWSGFAPVEATSQPSQPAPRLAASDGRDRGVTDTESGSERPVTFIARDDLQHLLLGQLGLPDLDSSERGPIGKGDGAVPAAGSPSDVVDAVPQPIPSGVAGVVARLAPIGGETISHLKDEGVSPSGPASSMDLPVALGADREGPEHAGVINSVRRCRRHRQEGVDLSTSRVPALGNSHYIILGEGVA